MDALPFIVSVNEEDSGLPAVSAEGVGAKGLFRRDDDTATTLIPTEKLKKELAAVSGAVLQMLNGIEQVGRFKLKEVTLGVEVSAEGGIILVGTAKVGGKAAITLKFVE